VNRCTTATFGACSGTHVVDGMLRSVMLKWESDLLSPEVLARNILRRNLIRLSVTGSGLST
jgi:hypothetical protein